MPAILITPPTSEPITLTEAKNHLRVTHNDEDTLISSYLTASRQRAETFTRRGLMQQTWRLTMPAFCTQIRLPMSPLQSVNSVKYIDSNGTEQTVDIGDYAVHAHYEPGILTAAFGTQWPGDVRGDLDAVRIEYVIGYDDAASVPGPIKSAILLMLGSLYRNRENDSPEQNFSLPESAKSLLWPYRILTF